MGFFLAETFCDKSSGNFLSRQGQFLCQWPLPTLKMVLCYSVTCWMFIFLQLTYFCPFNFLISALYPLWQLSPIPLQLPLQVSWLPLSVSGPWSGSMCRVHISLQELQVITQMLHRMAFYLSVRVIAFQLHKVLKRLIFVIKVAQYDFFFPDLPDAYWMWLTSMVLL